eukprot:jgi/Botrbrau1/20395/Bobra.0006s0056.1
MYRAPQNKSRLTRCARSQRLLTLFFNDKRLVNCKFIRIVFQVSYSPEYSLAGPRTSDNGEVCQLVLSNAKVIVGRFTGELLSGVPKNSVVGNFWCGKFKYSGLWFGGLPFGNGIIQLRGGDQFVGRVENFLRKGKGKIVRVNGDQYIGNFQCAKKHGEGILIKASGERLFGSWDLGHLNGFGTSVSRCGRRTYQGMFLEGAKHGHGTVFYGNGNKYVGNWVKDKKHGFGVFTYAKGAQYQGYWHHGSPIGSESCDPNKKVQGCRHSI